MRAALNWPELEPLEQASAAAHGSGSGEFAGLRHCIEHVAHLLPAQGPITAFVHHNTLHAFEDLPFEQGVVKGGEVLGCHPFLPEPRYRAKLDRGRIFQPDIEAVLREDLGDQADETVGPVGTRLQLRLGMLAHPLRTGPTTELRWVVEQTDALRRFRPATSVEKREQALEATRHWLMRDLRGGSTDCSGAPGVKALIDRLFERFDRVGIQDWSDKTWEEFSLHLLWLICQTRVKSVAENVPAPRAHPAPIRHCELLREVTGEDCDQRVDEILIRFCAAFLDQDFAARGLPRREQGFFAAFRTIYGTPSAALAPWLREAARELAETTCPLASIRKSLNELGVTPDEEEQLLAQTLLALRGFAGMIWQMEQRSDCVAKPAPKGSLVEYLAVRLILERCALRETARDALGHRGSLAELRDILRQKFVPHPVSVDQRAFQVFQLAQVLGWTPETLWRETAEEWESMVREIEAFSGLERRRIYHLAFERRYRMQTLDAIAHHCRRVHEGGHVTAKRPSFQLVTCIDEREESFRRALEEVEPDCETLGAAGFFAVAMNYKGAADAHYTPLCPVIIEPKHYVAENVVYTHKHHERTRRRRRRTIGTVTHQVHMGSRTFAGGWLAAAVGALASIPLVTRILFPRLTARVRSAMGGFTRTPSATQLQLERAEETPGHGEGHVGFSVAEMAGIVERLLRDMGLTKSLSRVIVICGHGSSSLNNPHEAAHDCGACGGGRGGPNARAFAQMANNTGVREIVAGRGLDIPRDTVFVGAYHNTCDDNVTYYDLERIPSSHAAEFEAARAAIDVARQRSAHERCRRFESAPLDLGFEDALKHVEGRAEDLSQVRPEYGHATNALCFVGRRDWSRGLFLDRRSFLQSYDPAQDDAGNAILTRILQAVIPVCGGINLEYYFSYVDPVGYGCGTKLPHNITSLLGVMNGAASDLRTGLPWQMVEIHEPVRLQFVIETTPVAMTHILEQNPALARLVYGHWVRLATVDPATSKIHLFNRGKFEEHVEESASLPEAESSQDWYRGWREHLGFATIRGAMRKEAV